ncbi:MAG: protein-glutamate O-methyltransferase [Aquabacterium sp.]
MLDMGVAVGANIGDREFERLRQLFERVSGIHLADSKKTLVCGRLSRRLRQLNLRDYRDYLDLIEAPDAALERQTAIDLLTTNETHFFREPRHFEFLKQVLARFSQQGLGRAFEVWSAACSTGEEPYSLAMVLAEELGWRPWHVHASDLSTRVLEEARRGLYPSQRAAEVPSHLSVKYLLEGLDEFEGLYLIDSSLRARVTFRQVNLMQPLPASPAFDVIFLRNVLIYFDRPSRRKIVEAAAQRLRPGGLLFIGHSETLHGITDVLEPVAPTVYRQRD